MMVTAIDAAEYLALLETRRALDRLVAARASTRGSDAQRATLREVASRIRAAAIRSDVDAFLRLDRSCDEVLHAAAGNPFAARAARPLHAHCRRFWSRYHRNGDLGMSAELHATILEAVAGGGEEAAATAADELVDYLERFTREALELV
jgi:DNA-binding GntR family transcriptional regulator